MLHEFPAVQKIDWLVETKKNTANNFHLTRQSVPSTLQINLQAYAYLCLQDRKLTAQSRQLDIDGEGAESGKDSGTQPSLLHNLSPLPSPT